MSREFTGTTSRRALIVGMTNTDQIGMWQAGPAAAEVIPDVETGGPGPEDAGDVDEATGLSAEDLAAFNEMRAPPPAGDEPAEPAEEDGELDASEGDGDAETEPAAAGARERTPQELATDAAAGKKTPPKTVAFGKYQRELKKANEALATERANAQKEREDRIKLAERVSIINEALAAQAQQAAQPAVDPNAPPENPFDEADIDPNEDYAASVQQIQRRQRFQMEMQNAVVNDVSETRADTELRDTFTRDFTAYARTEAGQHLPAAYQFLKDQRLTQIALSEFDKDPNDPNEVFTKAEVARMVQLFNSEEKWLVGNAIKQGKSPSQAIMKQAKIYGFKPQETAAAAPAPAARTAAPAPAARVPAVRQPPAPAAVPSAAEQLAALQQAQQDGRSLSDGGGAPPTGLTAELLLRMGDDEFAEMVDGMSKGQLDALMGRTAG